MKAKIKDFRNLSQEKLQGKIKDLKSELFNLRFQHTVNQLENPMRINIVKKDIARILTIMNEKKLEGVK